MGLGSPSTCYACGYDGLGNPLAVTDPRGFTTYYDRNEMGEIYCSTDAAGNQVQTYYDANRNVVRVDVQDNQPSYASNSLSAEYAQIVPTGSGSTAEVPMQAGPGGTVRSGWFTNLYSFDLLDNKTQDDIDATRSSPASLATTYTFDADQNLIQVTKPADNIVEFDYDERKQADRHPRGTGHAVGARRGDRHRLRRQRQRAHGHRAGGAPAQRVGGGIEQSVRFASGPKTRIEVLLFAR